MFKKALFLFLLILIISSTSIPVSTTLPTTIILDAGHGLPDGGAVVSEIIESDLNLQITLKLKKLLEKENINVILTRSNQNGIYDESAQTIREKKVSDMENRVKISKENPAELFISIHMNKLDDKKVHGSQVFYSKSEESKICAQILNTYLDNKPIHKLSNIYLAKNLKIPFVLIECGFMSNKTDLHNLQDEKYQDLLASKISKRHIRLS